jgi:hypothetical protein
MDFEFSNDTLMGLTRSLCNMPTETDKSKRVQIKIGKSANKVTINNLINLLLVSYNRANIDIEDIDVENMIKQD